MSIFEVRPYTKDGQKYFEWEHSEDHRDPCLRYEDVSTVSKQALMLTMSQQPTHIASE